MQGGLSTLEDECAESEGRDWEETLDQREVEQEAFRKRGLPEPEWIGNRNQGGYMPPREDA